MSWGNFGYKLRTRVLPNLGHLPRSRVRRCGACARPTLFVALGAAEEFQLCVRCRANQRYELLATTIRERLPTLRELDVLELDPSSPLRRLLSQARSYTRSYYRPDVTRGSARADGVVCEDITRLTYPDESLDLIVSSDVLEHVPDIEAAFAESARVLRPGGRHLFTVPPRPATQCRAAIENGFVNHLVTPPDYHLDPLDRSGILVYWDFGPDLPDAVDVSGLDVRIVAGPAGRSGRVVWEARKQGPCAST